MAERDIPTPPVATREPIDKALPAVPEGWDKVTQQEIPAIREGATPRRVLDPREGPEAEPARSRDR